MQKNTQTNLWQATAGAAPDVAILAEARQVDVVIIGAGFTGCSAALHLAQAGAEVCVLEANTVGFGGSGRNVGLVNAGLWIYPDTVDRHLGVAAGRKLYASLDAAPDLVFDLIAQHGIACEATRNGTLHCAHSGGGLAGLQQRQRQFTERGTVTELLDAKATAALTGTGVYQGALLNTRVGTIQPLSYVRGLATAAVAAGAKLFQQTPAKRISYQGNEWLVKTPQGEVRAKALLLTTNAYHQHLFTAGKPQYALLNYFQLATEPLTPEQLAIILPQKQGCWDTATVMTSFRLDAAGRLLLGAVGGLHGVGKTVHSHWAERTLSRLFPDLATTRFEYAWHGRIAKTDNAIPRVIDLGHNGLSIYGYSGRGIGPGTVFGKAAAEYLLSGDVSVLPVAPSINRSNPWYGLQGAYYETGAVLYHLVS